MEHKLALLVATLALAGAGCSSSGGSLAADGGTDDAVADTAAATDTATQADTTVVVRDPPTCASPGDYACPPTGAPGDSLPLVFTGSSPIETVEVTVIDGHAFTCGGFGLDVMRLGADDRLTRVASALPRCQNVIAGPALSDGRRVVYATNHGDAYVPTPTLYRLVFDPTAGTISSGETTTFTGTSPEGLAYDAEAGVLWVAAHSAGVLRYTVSPSDGRLAALDTLEGFDNANRLTLAGDHAWVADGGGGLKVVDRGKGVIVGTGATSGFAREVRVSNGMALVAASSQGVVAFDVSDPAAPELIGAVFTDGQALQLELLAGGDALAVANWLDVVVLDVRHPDALKVLAVDRGSAAASAPRVLGISTDGDRVVVGEWLGTSVLRWQPDLVGPELHLDRFDLTLAGVEPGASTTEAIQVSNRGWLPLNITDIRVAPDDGVWSATPKQLTLAPGEDAPLVLSYAPPDGGTHSASFTLVTDDPDEPEARFRVSGNPSRPNVGVGDALTADFDFLDVDSAPGSQAIGNLEGNVLVLAYFATF